MKVPDTFIFLDIDGPILSVEWRKSIKEKGLSTAPENIPFDMEKLKLIGEIVNDSNAKIILSSTWRFGLNLKDMSIEILPYHRNLINSFALAGLTIYDCTPVRDDRCRGKEINEWLNTYCEDNNLQLSELSYVIIDDDSEDIKYFIPSGRFLYVDGFRGISPIEASWVKRSLYKQNQIRRRYDE